MGIDFDHLPPERRFRAFGVDYAHLRTTDGGDLYVTRAGWSCVGHLLPENWYTGKWYARRGERLPGSTGTVYRVTTRPRDGQGMEVVVKFSRVGQEVPLVVASSFPEHVKPEDLAEARFNSPMEEFGLLMEIRRGVFGPPELRLLAQRPLAIYTPPEHYDLWRLGRDKSSFTAHQRLLAEDQEQFDQAIELDIRRQYVLLFNWIKGLNAEEAMVAGLLDENELRELTLRVIEELRAKGFRVLDNKPKHFVLRQKHGIGELLRRDGKLVYSLIDFELLERVPEYHRQFKAAQRARYFRIQSRKEEASETLPPHLHRVNILGVEYIYGTTANGGKLWVVGDRPELFDYFLPDRWRRTPRMKLALTNEVYRTRTRDNIHVVYRRTRVGERPYADPFYEQGKRIREQGYNSPFEEVALIMRLRERGMDTIHPRAIYRTGHRSARAPYLQDDRRHLTHAHLLTPDREPEPVLSPAHDFYTIWGYFRGMDPEKVYRPAGHWGFIDVEKALDDGVITEAEQRAVLERIRANLERRGLYDESVDASQFLLVFDGDTSLRRRADGAHEVIWAMDALTAFEHGVTDETTYRAIIERARARLDELGFELVNMGGNHLLLTITVEGELWLDGNGEPMMSLCNFELLRLRREPPVSI